MLAACVVSTAALRGAIRLIQAQIALSGVNSCGSATGMIHAMTASIRPSTTATPLNALMNCTAGPFSVKRERVDTALFLVSFCLSLEGALGVFSRYAGR
jgi:hypothetical protein